MEFPNAPIDKKASFEIDPESGRVFVTNVDLWSLNTDVDNLSICLGICIKRGGQIILPSIFTRSDGQRDIVFVDVKDGDEIRARGQRMIVRIRKDTYGDQTECYISDGRGYYS